MPYWAPSDKMHASIMQERGSAFQTISFPLLYVITEDVAVSPTGRRRSHEEVARAAAAGGASLIQIRDKSASTRRLVEVTQRCVDIMRSSNGLLFVNDRLDVALASGAHGVHLGDDDMPIAAARGMAGDRLLIGASVASVQEAEAAVEAGADYVSVGAIYSTSTKLDAGDPIGCEPIRQIKAAVNVPVAAIGGISLENVHLVVDAGADMICVVSAVTRAEDMTDATKNLLHWMKTERGD